MVALHERAPQYSAPRRGPAQQPRITESELSTLWAGQRLPASALRTAAGIPVRVFHPGRPGRGPGPDFRDAIIALPSGPTLRGDIELHVRASDFHAHGHSRDPAYDGVVLHVVFEDDAGGATQLTSGRTVLVVALAPWLRSRAQELHDWLSSPRLWQEPCHDAVARCGPAEVTALLDTWGDQRFQTRTETLAEELQQAPAGAVLLRALIYGLGYGGNRDCMSRVTTHLAWPAVQQALTSSPSPDAAQVEHLLLAAAGPALNNRAGRPANDPAKRLTGLARVIARHAALFAEDQPGLPHLLRLPPAGLLASFTAAPLIGRSRAVELLTNAVLPWIAAVRPDAAALAKVCYARLPRPAPYGAIGFLEENLGLRGKPLTARRQQGLLALYKSECSTGGCGRCAFS